MASNSGVGDVSQIDGVANPSNGDFGLKNAFWMAWKKITARTLPAYASLKVAANRAGELRTCEFVVNPYSSSHAERYP